MSQGLPTLAEIRASGEGIGRPLPRSRSNSPRSSSPRSRAKSTERSVGNPRLLAAAEPSVLSSGYDPTLPHHSAVGLENPHREELEQPSQGSAVKDAAPEMGGESRAVRWLRLAESHCTDVMKRRLIEQYDQFWGDVRDSGGKMVCESDATQIAKDLGRTYAGEAFCTESFLKTLERVLTVIAYYHKDGYTRACVLLEYLLSIDTMITESMNEIAGLVIHQFEMDFDEVSYSSIFVHHLHR